MVGWKPVVNNPNIVSANLRCLLPLAALRRIGRRVELFREDRESSYAAVVFQATCDSESLAAARRLKSRGAKVIFDLSDNAFHTWGVAQPDEARLRNLEAMTALADVVTVSTEELALRVPGCVSPPRVIRDGLEPPGPLVRWRRRYHAADPTELRVGWFGITEGSDGQAGVAELAKIAPVLNRAARSNALRLVVFSNSPIDAKRACAGLTFPWSFHPWRGARLFNWDYSTIDVTLLPLTVTPFSVCESSNRMALSLLLEVPVVADSIPSYQEFKDVSFQDQWEEGLRRYATDPTLRQDHAARGRALIESGHLVAHAAAEWAILFEGVGA